MSSTMIAPTSSITGNEALSHHVVKAAIQRGVKVFCLCPGSRNSPIVSVLKHYPQVQQYFLYEERSAAFFALGRARRDRAPVAIVVTSGSAAGELLPAAMEAYYTHVPILLITADRPRRFKGTNAPQTVEQVGLFGIYAPFAQDISEGETCQLENWDGLGPAHLNVRLEDPFRTPKSSTVKTITKRKCIPEEESASYLNQFFSKVSYPLAVVSTLSKEAHEATVQFLRRLNIPVMLEGISGLREDSRLSHLKVFRTDNVWNQSEKNRYPIDGLLRIGGVPTFSGWRDLENMQDKIHMCSLSELPYSGLSWADIVLVSLPRFLDSYRSHKSFATETAHQWLVDEKRFLVDLLELLKREPNCELSLVHALSKCIPKHSHVYLGNSLPLREWDLGAESQDKKFRVYASRGVNGIDGQLSTFLGLCEPDADNWALLGDLTTLYDMPGPWILSQLQNIKCNIVVINNSGGRIFSRFFSEKTFLHPHELGFEPLANLWGLEYERWTQIPDTIPTNRGNRLIEIIPDNDASDRVWEALKVL